MSSISLADFRAALRSRLRDATVYQDSQINQWLADGLNEYSALSPNQVRTTILITAAGDRSHSLAGYTTLIEVTRVEYPYGQAPARLLGRLDPADPRFEGGPYYDLPTPEILYLGESPALNEQIGLWYAARWPAPAADGDLITIPAEDYEFLRRYVFWRAADYVAAEAEIAVQRDPAVLTALRRAAAQAGLAHAAIAAALAQRTARSAQVRWDPIGRLH